jgi:hypothetical protein
MDYFFGLKSVLGTAQPEVQPSPADTVTIHTWILFCISLYKQSLVNNFFWIFSLFHLENKGWTFGGKGHIFNPLGRP